MSQLGLGVMINMLGGNEETVKAVESSLNKTIKTVKMDGNTLSFNFDDNSKLELYDNGQSCCEHRYMNTDDDLSFFKDCQLLKLEIEDGPTTERGDDKDWTEPTDSQFLKVETSKGSFTCVNYNEHNGYYGGFWVVAKYTK